VNIFPPWAGTLANGNLEYVAWVEWADGLAIASRYADLTVDGAAVPVRKFFAGGCDTTLTFTNQSGSAGVIHISYFVATS